MTTQNKSDQYSLFKILGIYVLASAPAGFAGWILGPMIDPYIKLEPAALAFGVARIIALTLALIWLFVLSLIIVRIEEGNLRWLTIKDRLWLHSPKDQKSGVSGGKVWLWLIPFFLLLMILSGLLSPVEPFVFDFFNIDIKFSMSSLFNEEVTDALAGAWFFLFLFLFMGIFNILGEEFLFRGILLPKMEGQFGKWDWVANGLLMGAYHWHQPWGIPVAMVASVFVFSFASRRYESSWMGIITHSVQIFLMLFLILGVITGLA